MIEEKYKFGYPHQCTLCHSTDTTIKLTVKPHYKPGSKVKIMLVGQDPTIFKDPNKNRVKEVLMLDQQNGKLRHWLKNLIGINNFEDCEIYATNIVKCTFSEPPSTKGKTKYLSSYFKRCQVYLLKEVIEYKPTVVFTFGEPAHQLFISLFTEGADIKRNMKDAFSGKFYKVKINDIEFDYSPCLHIKTFRVAETYGQKVINFKKGVIDYFK